MQSGEAVARHGGIHMMLGVIIHIPVKKAEKRVKDDRAAAEAEISHLVLKAAVLEIVANKAEPAGIEGGERDGERQEPPAHGYRNDHDGSMASEQETGPVDPSPSLRGFGLAEENLIPGTKGFSAGHHDGPVEDDSQADWVDKIAEEKSIELDVCDGKNHL